MRAYSWRLSKCGYLFDLFIFLSPVATNRLVFSTVAKNASLNLKACVETGQLEHTHIHMSRRMYMCVMCDEVAWRAGGLGGGTHTYIHTNPGIFRFHDFLGKNGEAKQWKMLVLGRLRSQAHTCTYQGIRATPLCLHHPLPSPPPSPPPASCCADLAGLRRRGSGCCLPPRVRAQDECCHCIITFWGTPIPPPAKKNKK